MEGENSQVEMKLSSDMDEEVGGNGVGEEHNHAKEPYVVHRPAGRTPKSVCFMVATVLLIFIISKNRHLKKLTIACWCLSHC